MPFRSYGELEQFKLIGKEAEARGLLGSAQAFDSNGQPVCWMGHTGAFMGVKAITSLTTDTGTFIETECGKAWGLNYMETKGITVANDRCAAGRVERVCAAADEIGVG